MKIDEEARLPDITEEASDALGVSDSPEEEQEESDDYFRPDNLPAEERAQFEKAVQAVEQFIKRHPDYKQTDENRAAILDYLADHDIQISPAALELAFEQLEDSLDLEPGAETPDEATAARVREASTDALAHGTKSEEESPKNEDQQPEEPAGKRGGKVIAFRNGRRVGVAG